MVASGAFGGSRQAVTEQRVQRNVEAQKAKTGGELRSRAFENAVKMGPESQAKLIWYFRSRHWIISYTTRCVR